jgi:prepilin-type N-terminal cleavage/methylation domain-containing protein
MPAQDFYDIIPKCCGFVRQVGWRAVNRYSIKAIIKPSCLRACLKKAGFTLVELLTVIAIIGVLAAFTMPVLRGVARTTKIARARSEMEAIESALDNYKAQYGFYPPGNGAGPGAALVNQLYYELTGVTNVAQNSIPCYQTLDGGSIVGTTFYANLFYVGGAVNCCKNADEGVVQAKSFLHLKPNEIGSLPITNSFGGYAVNFVVTSLGGPDAAYEPMGFPGLNPFRYVAPGPTNNNANGYDLWIQLVVGGKTNLISNWSQAVIINSPLP